MKNFATFKKGDLIKSEGELFYCNNSKPFSSESKKYKSNDIIIYLYLKNSHLYGFYKGKIVNFFYIRKDWFKKVNF